MSWKQIKSLHRRSENGIIFIKCYKASGKPFFNALGCGKLKDKKEHFNLAYFEEEAVPEIVKKKLKIKLIVLLHSSLKHYLHSVHHQQDRSREDGSILKKKSLCYRCISSLHKINSKYIVRNDMH